MSAPRIEDSTRGGSGSEVTSDSVLEELSSDGSGAGLEAEKTSPDGGEIKAPFDPAQIDVVTQMRTVDLLLSRLREGELNLSPDFQRRANLWTPARKSGLIESMLLRIPIPSLYVSEDKDGNYTVVDGLQRICAIAHFIDVDSLNKSTGSRLSPLRMSELQSLPKDEFDNSSYGDLPRSLQRRLKETELTLHVIRASTPPSVKFNIFSRINRGGLPLTAQEIRNAIYPGEWLTVARKLAESEAFYEATQGKIKGERLEDIELVLRFLAHYALGENCCRPVDQNLDDFLNDYVQTKGQWQSRDEWRDAQEAFTRAMIYAPKIFEQNAFRKYYVAGDSLKPINRGLFEAQSVSLARIPPGDLLRLVHCRQLVMKKLAELFNTDAEFPRSLLYATGKGGSSNVRIEKISKILRDSIS